MHKRLRPAVLLGCLLLSAYLLAYTRAPGSADGQALLAVAANLANNGHADIGVIGFTEWTLTESGRMGNYGLDGTLYSKKGLTPSVLLLPLVTAARVLPWLPLRSTAMLFNPIVTTLTALALYALARTLRYSRVTAFSLGLIYGLGTLAAVYVKTLFGEPLAGLLLIVSVLALENAPNTADHPRRNLSLYALAGLCLGLLIGINTIYTLFTPVIGLYALWRGRLTLRQMLAFALPVIALLALLALYNWARFGSPLESGYHFAEGEGFTTPLLTGLYGLFLSPYKGLVWYSPVLLLCVPGWRMFRRDQPRLAWLSLLLIALQALFFAGWWSWHGGIVWGPRFLLPVIPLLVLLLAPLVESARKHRLLAAVLIVFFALSAAVQVIGIALDPLIYEGYLRNTFWPDIDTANQVLLTSPPMFDPAYTPILGHIAQLRNQWPLEPAWLASGIDSVHLLIALALAGVSLLAASVRRGWMIALAASVICLNLVASRQTSAPEYQSAQALSESLHPPGTVAVASLLFDDALLDVTNGARIINMNAPTVPDDPLTQRLWTYALAQPDPFWFVSWFGPADPLNWQERELWQQAYFVSEARAVDHRVLRFDRRPIFEPDTAVGWQFGPITLTAYDLTQTADGVQVTLRWSAENPPSADYGWFVHLLDASGAIIAQHDRQPQGGYQPTSRWQPGEPIIDRLLFPVESDFTDWQVRVGWLDPSTGERLPTITPSGEAIADNFIVLSSD